MVSCPSSSHPHPPPHARPHCRPVQTATTLGSGRVDIFGGWLRRVCGGHATGWEMINVILKERGRDM